MAFRSCSLSCRLLAACALTSPVPARNGLRSDSIVSVRIQEFLITSSLDPEPTYVECCHWSSPFALAYHEAEHLARRGASRCADGAGRAVATALPQAVRGGASSDGVPSQDCSLDERAKIRTVFMPVDANGVLNRRINELLFAVGRNRDRAIHDARAPDGQIESAGIPGRGRM